ncbi:MAG: hypothetical protein IJ806_11370 [Ruminococcus sp.]|nr:hypothetical protein [Ruminococcus sp.]
MTSLSKDHRREEPVALVSFSITAIIIGIAAFFAAQIIFISILGDPSEESDTDMTLWHNYCGTFFIDQTIDNTYINAGNYERAKAAVSEARKSAKPAYVLVTAFQLCFAGCLFAALRKLRKDRSLYRKSGVLLIFSGAALAVSNVIGEVLNYIQAKAERPYLKGVPATSSYYCQLYIVLGIPALIVITGLLLSQKKTGLRVFAYAFGAVALGFTSYRLCIRVYELMTALAEWNNNARLPFYSTMMDLPHELANSSQAYTDIVFYRFLKDMPVFIAAGYSIIMLVLTMLSAAENGRIGEGDVLRLKLSIFALVIASVLFNVMGIHEVNFLNRHFHGIYTGVTYTIGIRSLCEPALFAVIISLVSVLAGAAGGDGGVKADGKDVENISSNDVDNSADM